MDERKYLVKGYKHGGLLYMAATSDPGKALEWAKDRVALGYSIRIINRETDSALEFASSNDEIRLPE